MRGSGELSVLAAVLTLAGCASIPAAPVTATAAISSAAPSAVVSRAQPASPSVLPSRSVPPSVRAATAAPASKGSAPQAIPWLDEPVAAEPPEPDPNRQLTHPVLYRRCSAGDLAGSFYGRAGAGMGFASEYVGFRNRSQTPCTLDQAPMSITDVDAGGVHHTLTLGGTGYGRQLDAVANLEPGQSGQTMLNESDECYAFQHPRWVVRVDFRLPDGTVAEVPADPAEYEAPVDCGLSASWFGTAHVEVPEPVFPTDPLVVTTTMPSAIAAGATVDYTVTLTNPTGTPIPLTPCPGYEEVLNVYPHIVDARYRLNCGSQRDIAPHESLTFAMRITSPSSKGEAKFAWDLLPIGGAGSGGAVAVQ